MQIMFLASSNEQLLEFGKLFHGKSPKGRSECIYANAHLYTLSRQRMTQIKAENSSTSYTNFHSWKLRKFF